MNGSIFFYSLNGNGSFEWIGSMMIWLLLLLSVANVVFIIIGANENARRSQLPDRAAIDMSELISAGRYQDAIKRAAAGEDDFSRILSRGLEHAPDGVEAMTHAAEQTADD